MVLRITEGTFFTICIVLVINLTYQPKSVDAVPRSWSSGGTSYSIYSCPLDIFGKKCRKRGWLPYAPYGIKHTYLKIGNTCYDWGDWNYVRHVSCSHPEIECCVTKARLKKSGSSACADRVDEFEDAWEDHGRKYNLFYWNCQKYVDAMADFLNNCYYDASDAIP